MGSSMCPLCSIVYLCRALPLLRVCPPAGTTCSAMVTARSVPSLGLQRSSATVRSHGAARPGDAIVLRGSAAVVRNSVPVAWPGHAALPALHLMTAPHVPPSPYVECTPRCLFAGSSRCGNLHYWATAPVRDSIPRCVVYSLKCALAVMRDHATTRYYGHRPLLRILAAP
jgi:hypothetical protein